MKEGYEGEVYPVNPKGGEILGKKVYTSINEIDGDIDMAIVITPAKTVAGIAEECGKKHVKWLVVITAGFSEVHTDEGKKMEEQLVKICAKHKMHLVGPNCLGMLNTSISMNASFAKELPPKGNIALISQSGAMAVALMDMSPEQHLGYSLVLSIGNKAAMDECDFLELCAEDDNTNVIGMYLESIKDGRRFLEVASRISAQKHIVLLKSGVSEHGKKAASSHTGALAGSDAAIQAACAQTGIHRAHSAQELLNLLRALSTQPPLLTENIVVITNAGGPGILATDAAQAHHLKMPKLQDAVAATLKEKLPTSASVGNPIDVIGDALEDRYNAALTAAGDDAGIDGICILLTPQVMTPCIAVAKTIITHTKRYPLMPITTCFMGGESVSHAIELLAEEGIPNFQTPEQAVKALSALRGNPTHYSLHTTHPKKNKKAQDVLKNQMGLIDEQKAAELLALYDLPIPKQAIATSADEAVAHATKIGLPVIAKISSPQILHKTDIGGIKANLKTEDDVREAFTQITANAESHHSDAEIRGVLIQEMLPLGNEFIVGGLRDLSFGPMVMVGLGGIYTELFKDTSFRIAPITEKEGYQMLQELQSWKLLLGMRGKEQSDIAGVVDVVVKVSQLMHDCESITELDFNPIFVREKDVIIADAKIVVSQK